MLCWRRGSVKKAVCYGDWPFLVVASSPVEGLLKIRITIRIWCFLGALLCGSVKKAVCYGDWLFFVVASSPVEGLLEIRISIGFCCFLGVLLAAAIQWKRLRAMVIGCFWLLPLHPSGASKKLNHHSVLLFSWCSVGSGYSVEGAVCYGDWLFLAVASAPVEGPRRS